jgi:hypothetical protein
MRRRRFFLTGAIGILVLSLTSYVALTRLGHGPGPGTTRSSQAGGNNPSAFRGANWLGATVPGAICRGSRPVHLRNGSAVARLTRKSDGQWHAWPRIYLTEERPVVYGSLAGHSAAAMNVGCNNGGGTADGYMAYADVIYIARPHETPRLIGIVRPHIRPWGGKTWLASPLSVAFRGDELIAHEFFYGGSDGTCCASGRATSIWRFAHGRLKRLRTTITHRPVRRWWQRVRSSY